MEWFKPWSSETEIDSFSKQKTEKRLICKEKKGESDPSSPSLSDSIVEMLTSMDIIFPASIFHTGH